MRNLYTKRDSTDFFLKEDTQSGVGDKLLKIDIESHDYISHESGYSQRKGGIEIEAHESISRVAKFCFLTWDIYHIKK